MNQNEIIEVTMDGVHVETAIDFLPEAEIVSVNQTGAANVKVTFRVPANIEPAAIDAAREARWTDYLARGGNPRNRRGISAEYAAIKRAITNARAA